MIYYWFMMPHSLCSKNVYSILGIMGEILGFHLITAFQSFWVIFWQSLGKYLVKKFTWHVSFHVCDTCIIKKLFIVYFLELLKYKKAYLELVVGYGNTGYGVYKGGYKIRQILYKNQTQRKLLNFGLKASCQK